MPHVPQLTPTFVGGRLALDFVNIVPADAELSWNQLIAFLESARIVTPERGNQLLALNRADPQAAESLLGRAQRLASALHAAFDAMLHRQKIAREWIEPLNEVLRVTEGHDELNYSHRGWE